jgi:hypothetical protein
MILDEGWYLLGVIIGMAMVSLAWFSKTGDFFPINMLIGAGLTLAIYSLIKNNKEVKWEN